MLKPVLKLRDESLVERQNLSWATGRRWTCYKFPIRCYSTQNSLFW